MSNPITDFQYSDKRFSPLTISVSFGPKIDLAELFDYNIYHFHLDTVTKICTFNLILGGLKVIFQVWQELSQFRADEIYFIICGDDCFQSGIIVWCNQ